MQTVESPDQSLTPPTGAPSQESLIDVLVGENNQIRSDNVLLRAALADRDRWIASHLSSCGQVAPDATLLEASGGAEAGGGADAGVARLRDRVGSA